MGRGGTAPVRPSRHSPTPDSAVARSAFVDNRVPTVPADDAQGRTGPLAGTVFAVKDLIDLAGWPTGGGRDPDGAPPPAAEDAPVVARFRSAGATPIGKTRTDELGLSTFTPGVMNPADPSRSVGGSSGGSAVAVATGVVDFALATDTAGSARIPAAAAGVAGICLRAGWESTAGVIGLSPTFDRLGMIAPTGADLAAIWRALGGAVSREAVGQVWTLGEETLGRVDPAWMRAAEVAARQIADRWDLGSVERLDVEPLASFGPPRAIVVTADASERHKTEHATTELVRIQLAAGVEHTADEVAVARAELERLGAQLRAALGADLLVLPTLPAAPPRWSELTTVPDQLRAIGRMTRLCAPVNSSGLVAASVHYGDDEAGLPLSLQLVGLSEAIVLAGAEELSLE